MCIVLLLDCHLCDIFSISDCLQAAEAKALGNDCMKQDKFLEALLHYTKAIKIENDDAALHSNRSLAFLKAQQYFHANEDADKVIELKPNWTKVCNSDILFYFFP